MVYYKYWNLKITEHLCFVKAVKNYILQTSVNIWKNNMPKLMVM